MKKNKLTAYNILWNEENSAELTMYGEVVQEVPTDFWTGEKIDGLYIVLADFLNDLEQLKAADSVTVRINSVGGDLFAGVAIYNRLKELKNVTTIVDGLAASAASIIAQAGATRKVYQASQVMIHGASMMLFDWYNVNQLEDAIKRLKAADDAVINVYAETTGENKTKLRHMVEATTWMTGQEAIDAGFADELAEGEVIIAASADKKTITCNGIQFDAKRLGCIPNNIVAITPKEIANKQNGLTKKEEKTMTIDELRNQYPDLVSGIENAAKQNANEEAVKDATNEERARIKDILSISDSIADKELVEDALFNNPCSAKDLAFNAMQKQAKLGNEFLSNAAEDAENSGAKDVGAAPAPEDVKTAEEVLKEKDKADIEAVVNMMNGGTK